MEGKILHETRFCNDTAGSGGNAERPQEDLYNRALPSGRDHIAVRTVFQEELFWINHRSPSWRFLIAKYIR